jgi:hypothetical protein
MNTRKLTPLLLSLTFVFSCEEAIENDLVEIPTPEPIFMDLSSYQVQSITGRSGADQYAILMAEYVTNGESGEMGNTIFFQDLGNKQLDGDFVPGLDLDGTSDVSYYIDDNRPSTGLSLDQTSAAINAAMDTWDEVSCSDLGMTQLPSDGRATGFVAEIFGFGGSLAYVADVTHSGWMPASFFDLLAPGGSNFILGVTFTIVFTDEEGNLVDTDNNNKFDVAWREIYYNDAFPWNIGATFDVETIALHEAGHGLSQAHFGKAFLSGGNGKLHFAPRAVMNAAYSGVQTSISQTDNGGHCSNWGQWPNN